MAKAVFATADDDAMTVLSRSNWTAEERAREAAEVLSRANWIAEERAGEAAEWDGVNPYTTRRAGAAIGDSIDVARASSGPNVAVGMTLYWLLKFTAVGLTLLQTAFFVYFVVENDFHDFMLTWWNQAALTGYLWLLTLALFVEGWLLWVVIVVLTPIIAALSLDINVAIVILVSQNGGILEDPDLTASEEYVGNWLIHTLDVIIVWGALFAAGLLLLMRAIIGTMWRELETTGQRALYVAFFLLSPLVLPFVYTMIWPISEHYPTGISDAILWVALIALNTVVSTFLLACVTLTDRVVVDVPSITSYTAAPLRLVRRMIGRGNVQPSSARAAVVTANDVDGMFAVHLHDTRMHGTGREGSL